MDKIIIRCDENDITVSEMIKKKLSKRHYKNLKFKQAKFYLNGKAIKTYDKALLNDEITIEYLSDEYSKEWPLYGNSTEIVFEDENYIVANKRSGLLSIPIKVDQKSLYQEMLYHLKENNESLNISIINRLDRETSGLCLIAKNRLAASLMSNTHLNMTRKYICLCDGIIDKDSGIIDNYIKKSENNNKRYISIDGKRAISEFKVIERYSDKTLVEFILKTGRTHQIRLHTSYLGHPIVGDKLYGRGEGDIFHLKSYYLEYIDPFTKEVKKFELRRNIK